MNNSTTLNGHDIDSLLNQRERTHGYFPNNAEVAQRLKDYFRTVPNWEKFTPAQREAFDLIASKLGRAFENPEPADHWADMDGYLELARRFG